MSSDTTLYVKASPENIEIDTEVGGDRFASKVRSSANIGHLTEIILDFSGNVRLDYWGCSRVLDTCIDLLGPKNTAQRKTLTVLTSLRYEDKESYAWLFFNKCEAAEEFEEIAQKSFSELAIAVCNRHGFQFQLFTVSLRFAYDSMNQELRNPNIVLSAR